MTKVRFQWKPSISGREQWRMGLFMFKDSRSGRGKSLRIMVRGVLIWLFCLAAAAYLGLATAWYFTLSQRSVNYVTWSDCVLAPIRWDEIKEKRGRAYITEGLEAMKDQRWSDAVYLLQAGVSRAPRQWQGRQNLGVFFIAAGNRSRGLKILTEDLANHYPGREALEMILQLALLGEDHDIALAAVEDALNVRSAVAKRDHEWLLDQKVRILATSKRYVDLLLWLREQPSLSNAMHEARILSYIELGRFDEADQALQDWDQTSGAMSGVNRLRVRLERERGNIEAMRTTLAQMRNQSPTEPTAWVYTIIQESMAGEVAEAGDMLDRFFMRFGVREQAINMLVAPLVEIQDWVLFDQVVEQALQLNMDNQVLRDARTEAARVRGDYALALRLTEQATPAPTDRRAQNAQENLLVWLRMLNEPSEVHAAALLSQLRQTPITLAYARRVADSLERIEAYGTAHQVLTIAAASYPSSPTLQADLQRVGDLVPEPVEMEIELPTINDGTEIDIAAYLPETEEISDELSVALGSPRQFKLLSLKLTEGEQWGELDRLLRELRKAKPAWMANERELIWEAEVAHSIGVQNWSGLITYLRLRSDTTVDHGIKMVRIARQVDAAGRRDIAERILAEVEKRHPNFPPARRLREQWAPPPEPSTEPVEAEAAPAS